METVEGGKYQSLFVKKICLKAAAKTLMLGSHHVVQSIGAVLTMTLHCPLSPQEELEKEELPKFTYVSIQLLNMTLAKQETVQHPQKSDKVRRGRKSEWIKRQILRCFKTYTNIQSNSLTIVVIIITIMMNSGGFRLSEGLGWKKIKMAPAVCGGTPVHRKW